MAKSNPNDVWGPNEYAGFVAPSRPDASTVTFYGDSSGNSFDRGEHLSNMGTKGLSESRSQAKPLGGLVEKGFGGIF